MGPMAAAQLMASLSEMLDFDRFEVCGNNLSKFKENSLHGRIADLYRVRRTPKIYYRICLFNIA